MNKKNAIMEQLSRIMTEGNGISRMMKNLEIYSSEQLKLAIMKLKLYFILVDLMILNLIGKKNLVVVISICIDTKEQYGK